MKTIDKYILGRFLQILGFALVAFILVVLIVDIVENVDKFIDYKAPLGLVVYYYILYTPFIIILVLPVAVLLATMFTIGALARFQELTVMKASGLSLYRLAIPLLLAGFVISIAAIFFADIIMVPAEAKRDWLKRSQIEHRTDSDGIMLANVIKPGRDGWVVFARTYNENSRTAQDVLIQKIQNNQIAIAVTARQMAWSDSGWILDRATRRVFEGEKEIQFSRRDTLWAEFLSQTPETMSHKLKKPRDTRFFELLDLINLKRLMGQDTARDRVELYLKISHPFINFILIIIGIPLAANPKRSGGSIGLGLSVIISFIYFVILRAGQSFGYTHELPPVLAATIGNIIFMLIGLVMFFKARK